ncbi:MAG TPA: hypothetical protein VIK72_19490 [Clostridiaceae bacterium]
MNNMSDGTKDGIVIMLLQGWDNISSRIKTRAIRNVRFEYWDMPSRWFECN